MNMTSVTKHGLFQLKHFPNKNKVGTIIENKGTDFKKSIYI